MAVATSNIGSQGLYCQFKGYQPRKCFWDVTVPLLLYSIIQDKGREMSDNRKAWTTDEDHAITTLVKKHGTHRWSEISKRMLDHFGTPARTGKQCRQRWHNHLNPKINKSEWTDEQERLLFECHQNYGNKWKSIAQHLKGRTDNDIKNKFYSSMRKKLRKINKMLGVKNSTSQVRQIKPKVLSNIIAAASSPDQSIQEAWQELSKLLFCRDDRKLQRLLKGEDKDKIIELIDKISSINEVYQESKEKEKDQGGERMVRRRSSKKQEPPAIIEQYQPRSKSARIKRLPLRKKQTSTAENKKKTSSTQNMNVDLDPNYNFSLSFGQSYLSPGFKSSFTPVLCRSSSFISNQQQKQSTSQWRDFLHSPMMTRSLARTPKMPTPGVSMSPAPVLAADFRSNQFGRPEIYDDIRSNIQTTVKRNLEARQ